MIDTTNTDSSEFEMTGESRMARHESTGLKGFLASTKGRLIAAVAAAVIIFAALGAIAIAFIFQPGEMAFEPMVTPAGGVEAPAPEEEVAEPQPRTSKPLSSTFVFRDVFVPTVKPTIEGTSTASGGTGGSTSTTGTASNGELPELPELPEDTLYLESVSTVDGEPVASLVWNGMRYSLRAGDELPGTPWQVVEVSSTTVVMLFGDSRVTLTVGQGVSK